MMATSFQGPQFTGRLHAVIFDTARQPEGIGAETGIPERWTVICENNYFRVVIDGEAAAVMPRTTTSEAHRHKANATAVQPRAASAMLKVMRGRPWTNPDHTGGPIDDVFDQLREHVPGLIVERLEVTYLADDDNVYFIGDDNQLDRIQVDTAPGGRPPFLIENGGQHETTDTAEAVTLIRAWLEQN